MSTYLTHGFVLKRRPWREGDRLYTIYTEHYGKMDLIAAGSQRANSKLASHLLPFASLEMMVARGRTFDRLASANLETVYLKPPYHLPTVILASSFLEIIDNATKDNQAEPKLFKLLLDNLQLLPSEPIIDNSAWRNQARYQLMQFIMKVLNITGLDFHIHKCEVCQDNLRAEVNFSWLRHGFIHKDCTTGAENIVALPVEVSAWVNKSASSEPIEPAELPLSVLGFLTDYLAGHTGRDLSTLKVLKSVL